MPFRFWNSLEADISLVDRLPAISRAAEAAIVPLLAARQLDPGLSDWTWAFIATVLKPDSHLQYDERIRRSLKNKVFEFRLRCDYTEFITATPERQVDMYFEQLHRSVDLLAKYKVSDTDRNTLHEMLRQARPRVA